MWRAGWGQDRLRRSRPFSLYDLQARSVRFANALRALGLARERVALLLHDTVDYPVAFWGAIRAGNVAIPLNTFLNVAQYAYILADSRASALIAAAPLAQAIWPIVDRLPYLRTIVLVGATPEDLAAFPGHDVHLFEHVIAEASAAPFTADSLSDEVAFWMYTSGSTGDPKGVKHVHSNLMATAKLFGQGVLGISGSDVVHSPAKSFFSYRLGNAMAFPLSVGATAVLWPPRPTPDAVFEIMRKHRPTIFTACRRSTPPCSRTGHRQGGSDRLRYVCRRAKRCPPISASAGARSSVSTCSTASAHRNAANLPEQPARRDPLWLHRQTGARLRHAHCRREGPRTRHRRDRRVDRARPVGRRRLLESARQSRHPFVGNGPIPATNIAATPTATIITADAPTTCSR